MYADLNLKTDFFKGERYNVGGSQLSYFDYHEREVPAYLNKQLPEAIVPSKKWYADVRDTLILKGEALDKSLYNWSDLFSFFPRAKNEWLCVMMDNDRAEIEDSLWFDAEVYGDELAGNIQQVAFQLKSIEQSIKMLHQGVDPIFPVFFEKHSRTYKVYNHSVGKWVPVEEVKSYLLAQLAVYQVELTHLGVSNNMSDIGWLTPTLLKGFKVHLLFKVYSDLRENFLRRLKKRFPEKIIKFSYLRENLSEVFSILNPVCLFIQEVFYRAVPVDKLGVWNRSFYLFYERVSVRMLETSPFAFFWRFWFNSLELPRFIRLAGALMSPFYYYYSYVYDKYHEVEGESIVDEESDESGGDNDDNVYEPYWIAQGIFSSAILVENFSFEYDPRHFDVENLSFAFADIKKEQWSEEPFDFETDWEEGFSQHTVQQFFRSYGKKLLNEFYTHMWYFGYLGYFAFCGAS